MKLLAVFIACLVMAGYASAGGTYSIHEQTQDTKIQELRAAVKTLYKRERYDDFRLKLIACDERNDPCDDLVRTWEYAPKWPGWEAFRR